MKIFKLTFFLQKVNILDTRLLWGNSPEGMFLKRFTIDAFWCVYNVLK